MIKKCAICEKEFETKTATKTCSEECHKKLYAQTLRRCLERKRTDKSVGKQSNEYKYICKQNENDSLCWYCQNACGNCSWSRTLKPVEGWEVNIIDIQHKANNKTYITQSYKVINCPEYIPD